MTGFTVIVSSSLPCPAPPELLVGVTSYGRAIDILAIGRLFLEMLMPLFPGESDIDQLHLITMCFGEYLCILVREDYDVKRCL